MSDEPVQLRALVVHAGGNLVNDVDDLIAARMGIGFEAVGLRLQGALVFGRRLADVERTAAAAGAVAQPSLGVYPFGRDVQAAGFRAARALGVSTVASSRC